MGPWCTESGGETDWKAGGGGEAYLESIGFDTVGFEEVIAGAERCEFGREHRQFDQSVLSQRQHLQQGQLREGPVFDLRDHVPCQVNPLQSHCWVMRKRSVITAVLTLNVSYARININQVSTRLWIYFSCLKSLTVWLCHFLVWAACFWFNCFFFLPVSIYVALQTFVASYIVVKEDDTVQLTSRDPNEGRCFLFAPSSWSFCQFVVFVCLLRLTDLF